MGKTDYAAMTDSELETVTDQYVQELAEARTSLVRVKEPRDGDVRVDLDDPAQHVLAARAHDLGQADGAQTDKRDEIATLHHTEFIRDLTNPAQDEVHGAAQTLWAARQRPLARSLAVAKHGHITPWWEVLLVVGVVAVVELLVGKTTLDLVFGLEDVLSWILAATITFLPIMAGFALVADVHDRRSLNRKLNAAIVISLAGFFAGAALVRATHPTSEGSSGSSRVTGRTAQPTATAEAASSSGFPDWVWPASQILFFISVLVLGFSVAVRMKNQRAMDEESTAVDHSSRAIRHAREKHNALRVEIAHDLERILAMGKQVQNIQVTSGQAYIAGVREFMGKYVDEAQSRAEIEKQLAALEEDLAVTPDWLADFDEVAERLRQPEDYSQAATNA